MCCHIFCELQLLATRGLQACVHLATSLLAFLRGQRFLRTSPSRQSEEFGGNASTLPLATALVLTFQHQFAAEQFRMLQYQTNNPILHPMTKRILVPVALIFCAILGCENRQRGYEAEQQNPSNSNNSKLSSSAAVENNKDSTRKFIRKADVKFRVTDVLASTYRIELITSQNGGFVTFTNLSSQVHPMPSKTLSIDSVLESIEVRVSNTMTLRVPNTKLDTVLREIGQNIDFLDYRVITAEDVALQVLSNNLQQKRLSSDKNGLTSDDADKLQQRDNAKIAELRLLDEINFSTIRLEIYQAQSIQRRVVSNTQNIEKYKPSFGKQIQEAFRDGWSIFEVMLVLLTKLWGLVVLGIVLFVLYRFLRSKFDQNLRHKKE